MKYLKKVSFYYLSFSGKAGRVEYGIYWFMNIFTWIFILYLNEKTNWHDKTIIYLFYIYFILLLKLIPINAAKTRRLRDLDLNTGLILISFIPIVNMFFDLFLLFKKGRNQLAVTNTQ